MKEKGKGKEIKLMIKMETLGREKNATNAGCAALTKS